MKKNDIKNILMSMRNDENGSRVNYLLGKIDLLPEEELQQMISKIGNDEESIRKYLEEKLSERHEQHSQINSMFTYGIAESCIHLHMPIDLHTIISEKGFKKTFDIVNLYLLDALEKIRILQRDGFHLYY